jgi:CRISPR-associated protein Cmr3
VVPVLPPAGSEPTKFDTGWLCEDGLLAYLKGNACGFHVHSNSALFIHEPRFGVQIDSRPKRPTEGMLYQVEFVRLQEGVGLLVEVEGVTLPDRGLLQLGGEARAGRYEKEATGLDLPRDGRLTDSGRPLHFKVYLATPALFERGWLPKDIDALTLKGSWRGIDLTLVSAAIGKPQAVGGRDIARGDVQRSMRRAVPAGSIYFFETNADGSDVVAAFDGKCVSDTDEKIGFGLCYVGSWNA